MKPRTRKTITPPPRRAEPVGPRFYIFSGTPCPTCGGSGLLNQETLEGDAAYAEWLRMADEKDGSS